MNEQRPIQVGLIGCGKYARNAQLPHLLGVQGPPLGHQTPMGTSTNRDSRRLSDPSLSQFHLVAMANRSVEHLKLAAATANQAGFEPKIYENWRSLVEDEDVKAVVCTLPPAFNLAVARRCAELGKPLLMEKPLAVTVDQLQEFEVLAQALKTHIQVGTQLIFSEWFREFERTALKMGDVLALNSQVYLSDDWAFEPLTWKVDAQSCGGILNSWGVHPLTLMLKLARAQDTALDLPRTAFDYDELVAFTGTAYQRDHVDPAMYDTVSASWLAVDQQHTAIPCQLQLCLHPDVEEPTWRVEVVGAEGRVEGDLLARTIKIYRRGGHTRIKTLEPFAGPGHDGNRQQLEFFAQCIRAGVVNLETLHLNLTASRLALQVNVNPLQAEGDGG